MLTAYTWTSLGRLVAVIFFAKNATSLYKRVRISSQMEVDEVGREESNLSVTVKSRLSEFELYENLIRTRLEIP